MTNEERRRSRESIVNKHQ